MPAGIWSFLQAQINLLMPGGNTDSTQQGLTGQDAGAFDALMTEYTARESAGQEQVTDINPNNTQQAMTLTQGRPSAFSGVRFLADDGTNTQASTEPYTHANTESRSPKADSWRNLFADSRRITDNPARRTAEIIPQNDFDEGVTAVEPEISRNSDMAGNMADNVRFSGNEPPESVRPDFVSHNDGALRQEVTNNEAEGTNIPQKTQPIITDKPQDTQDSQPVDAPNDAPETQRGISHSPKIDETPGNDAPSHEPLQQEDTNIQPSANDTPKSQTVDAHNDAPKSQRIIPESPKFDGTPENDAPIHEPLQQEDTNIQPSRHDTPKSQTVDAHNDAPKAQRVIPESPEAVDTPENDAPIHESSQQEDTDIPLSRQDTPKPQTVDAQNDAPETQRVIPQSPEIDGTPGNDALNHEPLQRENTDIQPSANDTPKPQTVDAQNYAPKSQRIIPQSPEIDGTPGNDAPIHESSQREDTDIPPSKHDTPKSQTVDAHNDAPKSQRVIPQSPKIDETPENDAPIHESSQPEDTDIPPSRQDTPKSQTVDAQNYAPKSQRVIPESPEAVDTPENDAPIHESSQQEATDIPPSRQDTPKSQTVDTRNDAPETQRVIPESPEIDGTPENDAPIHESSQREDTDIPPSKHDTPKSQTVGAQNDAPKAQRVIPESPEIDGTPENDAPSHEPLQQEDTDIPPSTRNTQKSQTVDTRNDAPETQRAIPQSPKNDTPIQREIPADDSQPQTVPANDTEDYGIPASDTGRETDSPRPEAPAETPAPVQPRRNDAEPAQPRKVTHERADSREDSEAETPEKTRAEFPGITDAVTVMAGFAQVQPTQNAQPANDIQPAQTDSPSEPRTVRTITETPEHIIITAPEIPVNTKDAPEIISESTPETVTREMPATTAQTVHETVTQSAPKTVPESTESPKISRTPRRKTQAMTHDSQPEITQATETDSQPKISRTQNHSGHEESTESESRQPSQNPGNDSQTDGAISPERVRVSPARASRTAPRNDSQNEPRIDSRKAEVLSDFQSFFDTVTRAKRLSSPRVNTSPLSLRTDTYEANGVQSQGRTLRNGIVNVVRFIRADNVRKANIIVDPPALGRISVELTSTTSGVEASVKVASEQIRQIVQEQFTQLRDNLAQQGVQVSEFTVDVQQDSSRQGQDSGGQNQRDYYSYTPSDNDDDTENFRADLEEGLLYWIA